MEQVIQGSDSWKLFRRSGLGASDANIIMGHGFKRSVHDLWLDKVGLGQEVEVNDRMQRGITLEPYAREWAEREFCISFPPIVRKHRTIDYMFASSDGYNEENNVLIEIKTCEKLHETIPDYYIPQMTHLYEVFKPAQMFYISYDGTSGKIIEFKPDEQYLEKLLLKEQEFWYKVSNFTEPELSEKDYVVRSDDEYRMNLNDYLLCEEKVKFWEELKIKAKEKLLSMTDTNTICNGVKISQIVRKGTVDHKKLYSEFGIDQDKVLEHTKPPIKYWIIK